MAATIGWLSHDAACIVTDNDMNIHFTPLELRLTPSSDRVPQVHCQIDLNKSTKAYATESTKALAQSTATRLIGLHIHALSAKDAKEHKATYQGIPAHYRLARGVS